MGEEPFIKKLEKQSVFYQQIIPMHHCGVLLASAGELVAPLGLLFAFLVITWGVLGPLGPKLQKYTEKLAKIAKRDVFVAYLSADEH